MLRADIVFSKFLTNFLIFGKSYVTIRKLYLLITHFSVFSEKNSMNEIRYFISNRYEMVLENSCHSVDYIPCFCFFHFSVYIYI